MTTTQAEQATSVRLNPDDLDKLDRVVELKATTEAACLVGGRWGRSTVLRLAVGRGLDGLLDGLAAAGKRGPTASPVLPADAPNDDNARAGRLGAPEGV
jgi:hypothetical protein